MKNRIYIVLLLGLVFAIASECVVEAQSAGGGSKVESLATPQTNAKVEILRNRFKELDTRHGNFRERRRVMLAEFREKSISDISFEEVFRMLNVQKVELAIELEGLKARSNLLKEKLRTPDPEAEGASKLRGEAAELQRNLTQQRLETITKLFKKGARSKAELDTAKHEFALAKLQLELNSNKAANPNPAFVKAMFEVTLEIAEKTAKQSKVEKMLNKYIDSRDDFIEFKELDGAIEDSADWLRQLSRLMATPELMGAEF